MTEPILTVPNQYGTGRPQTSDEQYSLWLMDMMPFLKQGASLNYSIEKAGLEKHAWIIYGKYRLNDWFSQKVDRYRAYVGELVNMVGFKMVENIKNRLLESDGKVGIMTSEELQVWKTMAEKHRSSQPFFVTRVETSEADDSKLGKIIDTLEQTDYEDLAREAQKQMVEANPSVQDQGQTGQTSNVQAQSDAASPPSGAGQPPVQ